MEARVEGLRRLALALLAIGLGAGIALLLIQPQDAAALVDERERRLALRGLAAGAIPCGLVLLALRRWLAPRLVPLLAAGTVLAAIFALVVTSDALRAHRTLVELARSVGGENDKGCHRGDPQLGWLPRPGAVCPDTLEGNFEVTYRIDAEGFRVTPRVDDPELRIFFFGDSYTFGHGVADEETFPHLLAARYFDERVRIVNAGVDGYGLVQMYGRLLRERERLRPGDLVVFSPISHDLSRNVADLEALAIFVVGGRPYPELGAEGIERVAIDGLANRAWVTLMSGPLLRDAFRFLRRALYAPPNVREGHAILAAARETVEARGARFAYLFLPRVREIRKGRSMVDVSSFDFPDIRHAFPRDDAALRAHRFPDDGHWNARGHAVAAQALAQVLVEEGLVAARYRREATLASGSSDATLSAITP